MKGIGTMMKYEIGEGNWISTGGFWNPLEELSCYFCGMRNYENVLGEEMTDLDFHFGRSMLAVLLRR